MKTHLPRVFTITPGAPFLATVASSLCAGKLVEGFAFNGNPLILADATIYVPTRRAARELRSAFLDEVGESSVLLPTIRPLGEFDDDLDFFSSDPAAQLAVTPAIDPLQRQVLLGRLVADWTKNVTQQLRQLYGNEEIATPVTVADAFWLAADLADVIDQMHAEGKTVDDVRAATDRDESNWWGITLAFLEIVKSEWPVILKERNRVDPATHRNEMIAAEMRRLQSNPGDKPIIVAGSTGSIPATADLIATIAKLPNGAVILPGYDLAMSEDLIEKLDTLTQAPSVVGHPQFGMRKLVRQIGVNNRSVERLGDVEPHLAARADWVAQSLLPPDITDQWKSLRHGLTDETFDGVALLEAANEAELAVAIAAAMRETIHNPQKRTALVTPDRNLARRVAIELARYDIEANDSGGIPFATTSHGQLLSLLFSVVFEPGDPAKVLALLKHELCGCAIAADEYQNMISAFEHIVLRSGRGRFDPAQISAFFERQTSRATDSDHKPAWTERFDKIAFESAREFAVLLQRALAPLVSLTQLPKVSPSEAVIATIRTIETLCADEHGRHDRLYEGAAGEMLESILARLLETDDALRFEPHQWPRIIEALSGSAAIKPAVSGHPRVFIWGTLEARLQHVDQLILGGLNEGTWPHSVTNDAFLTRQQKDAMGMEPPERRIGLSAHDFQMAMGQTDVVLARTLRSDGAPTIASRWWQRLCAMADANVTATLLSRGERLRALGKQANAAEPMEPAKRPAPAPPLAVRPKSFSVTQIETLKNDPYAIFAKKILKLTPVEPMIRDPNDSDRGKLFHTILERAVEQSVDFQADDAGAILRTIADVCFEEEELPAEIKAVWWPRFDAMVEPFIEWERNRDTAIAGRFAELKASATPVDETGVSLTARADRIDLRRDGEIDIIDYKTGVAPSSKQMIELLDAQLALEAALAQRGAFETFGPVDPANLIYLALKSRGEVNAKSSVALDDENDLAGKAWTQLVSLLNLFNNPDHPYLSQARPKTKSYAGDYDHLARVLEWSAGDADAGEDGGTYDD